MALDQYLQKAILDWSLNGATPTRPPGCWIQFATGTPNTAGASDGPFVSRVTCTFAAANSAQGSVTNLAAITGASATAAATAQGWNIYDRSQGGTRLYFGTLTANLGCKSATDNPAITAGGLKVIIS